MIMVRTNLRVHLHVRFCCALSWPHFKFRRLSGPGAAHKAKKRRKIARVNAP